eukprot:4783268-Amphidinium_carterae.1
MSQEQAAVGAAVVDAALGRNEAFDTPCESQTVSVEEPPEFNCSFSLFVNSGTSCWHQEKSWDIVWNG